MRVIDRRFFKMLLLCALTLLIPGCGGGTMGTGIQPTGFGMKSHGTEVSFVLVATVKDADHHLIPGAVITISGSGGTVSRKSDRAGQARLPLMMRSGEYLEFTVEVGHHKYLSTQQLSPAGAREVEQSLIIDQSGALEIK